MKVIKLRVPNLIKENFERFEQATESIDGVRRVDSWKGRAEVEIEDEKILSSVLEALSAAGFNAASEAEAGASGEASRIAKVRIGGMTCRSCEITIERKFKKIPGVRKVDVNAARGIARIVCEGGCEPNLDALKRAIAGEKYTVLGFRSSNDLKAEEEAELSNEKVSFFRLIGLFALVFLFGSLISRLGFAGGGYSVSKSMSFFPALVLGLVAGTSSCLAVSGGLLLSSAAKFREFYGGKTMVARLRPVLLFIGGRVASYGLLGGIIGAVGNALTPSPFITGVITVIAAVYMVIMGLEMLKIAPAWLKQLLPRMPKSFSHKIMDAEGREHWAMPSLLGGATFFLPCGFTQALQLYALTTKSFAAGGLVLAGFALGTAPALFTLGWASSSLKGSIGKLFFQFSGALVIVLGLTNMQNGLAVAGYPVSLPKFTSERAAVPADKQAADSNVVFDGKKQLIRMKLVNSYPYYSPSNRYTVRAGIPVKIEINSYGTGCRSAFVIPQLGVRTFLDNSINEVEFTPSAPGAYSFSCSMGMYRGTLNVIP